MVASVTAYAASSVPCGSNCSSQTRTCSDGTLSNSYTKSSCSMETCTLSASLSANPTSGNSPLNDVDLTATAGGSQIGTINYTFIVIVLIRELILLLDMQLNLME